MVKRKSLDKSNCIHKSTHIFSFFCCYLPVSLVEVPRIVSVPQLRNENICYNFFVIVPHKGCQIKVLFLKCMEANGCEVFCMTSCFRLYCHIVPLLLRQNEMRWGKKPSASLMNLRVACCLATNFSFLTQAFPI